MIRISIDSGWFLLLLLLSPLIFMVKERHYRGVFFFICSLVLYAASLDSWRELIGIVIFLMIPLFYIYGNRRRKLPLWPFTVLLIFIFIYLNGYTWIIRPIVGRSIFRLTKSLGLSYILFRQLDVMVHSSAGMLTEFSPIDYGNYLFSFYTIMAGPIQRFKDFTSSFYQATPLLDKNEILKQLHRAVNGLLKILIFGVLFKDIADSGYDRLLEGKSHLTGLLMIFYFYPLYVYFNFSGYCDVVIGIARWAGFSIPENFNRPYLARNMIEFWNRWHITLSEWLRDFLYQPHFKYLLTGYLKKSPNLAQYISIFITFFVAGVWHGTTINFIVFGLLHGSGMALSMMYRDTMLKVLGKERFDLYRKNIKVTIVETMITIHFVCFTFLFFEYDIKKLTTSLLNLIT
ncbi:MAG: MBOAT family O-acyltransferase [bacterium]